MTSTERDELALRVTLLRPPAGAGFALQRGRDEHEAPSRQTADEISFDFTLRLGERPDGAPNFLGPYAQGPPAARFVYVASHSACGRRRAKVPLAGVGWELIAAARETPGAVLEARIAGTARDGGPACATVPLLDGGWKLTA